MLRKLMPVLIAVSISSNAAASSVRQKSVSIRAAIVDSYELFDKFQTIGLCKNDQSRDYYANVAGSVDFISPQQGQNVVHGDLIIAINKALAETIRNKSSAALRLAEVAYERDKVLFAKKVISEETLETSRTELANAKYELAQAVNTYNDMVITAPFDGNIGVARVKIGDHVNIGDYLFSIVSASSKNIILELPESIYKAIHDEIDVRITDSNSNVANTKIAAITSYLSDNGTIRVKVNIDNQNFIHGSYVQAELFINKHYGLAIPEQAVLRNENGDFIYKIDDNNLIKQLYIQLGTRTNNLIEITSNNLKEGDKIVLEGLTKVQDDTVVNILN